MLIIERIEGDIAVCELDGESAKMPLALLPEGIRPGNVLREGDIGWEIDEEETHRRRERAVSRFRRLFGASDKQ